MKKLLSILLISLIIFTTAASANEIDDFWQAIEINPLSGRIQFEIGLKFEEPLNPEMEKWLGFDDYNIENIKLSYDIMYAMNAEGTMLDMYCNYLFALPEYESSAIKSDNLEYWWKVDMTNPHEQQALIILKTSSDDRYMYMNTPSAVVPDPYSTQGTDSFLQWARKNMSVTYQNEEYRAVLAQDSLLAYCKEVVFQSLATFAYEELPSEYIEEIHAFFDKLAEIKLFADDAIVLTMTIDDQIRPKTMDISINIDTNLAEISSAFDLDWTFSADVSDIKASIYMNTQFSQLDEQITIDYPELTPENSVDLLAPYTPIQPSPDQLMVVQYNEKVAFENQPLIVDNTIYLPLRETWYHYGLEEQNIGWDNGQITIDCWGDVSFLQIESNAVAYQNEIFYLSAPVILIDGITYVPSSYFVLVGALRNETVFKDGAGKITGCFFWLY